MEFFATTPYLDVIVLLILMFVFARHEADWEFTTARSGFFFGFLNPKAVLIFWPQCILCRILVAFELLPLVIALLLFFVPLAPLLHRFFYIPWRKSFLIAGCMVLYMTPVGIGMRPA